MKMKIKREKSKVGKFREYWLKKGYELIDITHLCEPKIGDSGWCNDINEPQENIYHIVLNYRNNPVVIIGEDEMEVMDDDAHCIFGTDRWKYDANNDFIIFRKVKTENGKKEKTAIHNKRF